MDISLGDLVRLTSGNDNATGTVEVCSTNRQALVVRLDDDCTFHVHSGGIYAEIVPLVMQDGQYRELMNGDPVKVTVLQRGRDN